MEFKVTYNEIAKISEKSEGIFSTLQTLAEDRVRLVYRYKRQGFEPGESQIDFKVLGLNENGIITLKADDERSLRYPEWYINYYFPYEAINVVSAEDTVTIDTNLLPMPKNGQVLSFKIEEDGIVFELDVVG